MTLVRAADDFNAAATTSNALTSPHPTARGAERDSNGVGRGLIVAE
jgi:hypothetical protein